MKNNTSGGSGFIGRILWQTAAFMVLAVIIGLAVNSLRADGLELPGNWSDEARMTLESGVKLNITLEEAKKQFDAGKAVFLDARPHNQYLEGHIQGARSFPSDEFDDYFEKNMMDVPEDALLIAYCDGEVCELSKHLAKMLSELGFSNVRVLINGWTLWQENQFPSEKSDN